MPKYGYKFVFCDYTEKCLALIKLEIPDDAIIVRPIEQVEETFNKIQYKPSRKLRCNKYKFIEVVDFYKFDYEVSLGDWRHALSPLCTWKIFPTEVNLENIHFRSIICPETFEYKLNEDYISELDTNIDQECGTGLHYFETIEDAEKWIEDDVNPNWIIERYYVFDKSLYNRLYDRLYLKGEIKWITNGMQIL